MGQLCTIDELKANPQAVINTALSTKQPVFIEQAGRAHAAVVDVDTYLTQMQALREFRRIYAQAADKSSGAEEDVDASEKVKNQLASLIAASQASESE